MLWIFLAVLVGCASPPAKFPTESPPPPAPPSLPAHQNPRGKYRSHCQALYSTNVRGIGWRFLLMPDEFLPKSPANYGNLYRAEELRAAFRQLPRGAQVIWRDNLPNAWRYPSETIEHQVERAARTAGVSLQTMPSLYHEN